MATTTKKKTVILRALRTASAVAVAGFVGWLSGPDVTELLGAQNAVLLAAVATPLLVALEKALRYGKDPGES